ncbi:MAG TPA: MarR family transcriptional regulator [Segeticoccus sp.]|uniref:MarR family winged helix-turn-helix transcriptional regulator n=1 Tax=Segeticoccus sp. TaxID=2706531 RepID=UPI002D7F4C95|nr:MarR family transcriptional regulator [Segeticoccus sp.]HET8600770.1 MarR family transcriptional regulator [Segeticoccus sp.]
MEGLSEDQYALLFTVRHAIRQYMRWSEQQASLRGLSPQQHQLLLAIRAHPGDMAPSTGQVADYLMVRPNSAVELIGRVEAMGLVARCPDHNDQRIVRVALTDSGRALLEELAAAHLQELERIAGRLQISAEFLEHLSTEFIEKTSGHDALK